MLSAIQRALQAPRGLQLNPSTSTNPGGHPVQEQEDLTGALEEALDDTSDSSRSTIQVGLMLKQQVHRA